MPRHKGAAGAGVRVVGFRRSMDPAAAGRESAPGVSAGSAAAPSGAMMMTTVVRQRDVGSAGSMQSLKMQEPLASPSASSGGSGRAEVAGWGAAGGSERVGQSDSVSLYVSRGSTRVGSPNSLAPSGLASSFRLRPSASRDGAAGAAGHLATTALASAPPGRQALSASVVYGSADRPAPAELSNSRFPAVRATIQRADTHDEYDAEQVA